jgi:hypothetical protein
MVFAKSDLELPITTNKAVRVDFESYRWAVSRIEKANGFVPNNSFQNNPFLVR